jgi:hypothetical protein
MTVLSSPLENHRCLSVNAAPLPLWGSGCKNFSNNFVESLPQLDLPLGLPLALPEGRPPPAALNRS